MQIRSYHGEVQRATSQILDVFSNIYIDRRTDNGVISTPFLVPCCLGNRSRVLKSLENANKTVKLPIIVLTLGNIARDTSRVFGIHDGMFYAGSTNAFLKNMPTPVNINFELNIISKYNDDQDQILSNFLVHFNPDIFVSSPCPIDITQKMKNQILWDTKVSILYPDEVVESQPARFIATTNFVFKTWMWFGLPEDVYGANYIKHIYDDFYGVPMIMEFEDFYNNLLSGYITSGTYGDLLHMSGEVAPASGWLSGSL